MFLFYEFLHLYELSPLVDLTTLGLTFYISLLQSYFPSDITDS